MDADDFITIPERVSALEQQSVELAGIAANLTSIVEGLSAVVADLRATVYTGTFDPSLPDIEKDLKTIREQIDKTWPPAS